MGKLTFFVIFHSFLYVYQAGYMKLYLPLAIHRVKTLCLGQLFPHLFQHFREFHIIHLEKRRDEKFRAIYPAW